MEARDIIIKPVVTEKSIGLMEHNKYVFKVALSANKIEIKKAVEEIFKVKVVNVNTVITSSILITSRNMHTLWVMLVVTS